MDLREERQEVIQALLELDCIPSGMELFPAADEDQWSLIKNVIDECDYYVLILAGRYGSTNDKGVSYTEMEYRYALESSKPIIAFLHEDISKIEVGKSESDPEQIRKLNDFQELAKKKMCRFWLTPEDLGSKVSRSVIKLQRSNPAVGWVRGDVVSDKEASQEILRLNKDIQKLEQKLYDARTQAPEGTENLAQGNDKFTFRLNVITGQYKGRKDYEKNFLLEASWNKVFSALSPSMINEANNSAIRSRLEEFLLALAKQKDEEDAHMFSLNHIRSTVLQDDFETTLVQFRALGLMKKSDKNRSVKDTDTYWTLTPYGSEVMNRLRAILRI